jgi:hypothetical protein
MKRTTSTTTTECACIQEMLSLSKEAFDLIVQSPFNGRPKADRELIRAHFQSQGKRRSGIVREGNPLWASMLCLAIIRKRDARNEALKAYETKVSLHDMTTAMFVCLSAEEVIASLTLPPVVSTPHFTDLKRPKEAHIIEVKNFDPGHAAL